MKHLLLSALLLAGSASVAQAGWNEPSCKVGDGATTCSVSNTMVDREGNTRILTMVMQAEDHAQFAFAVEDPSWEMPLRRGLAAEVWIDKADPLSVRATTQGHVVLIVLPFDMLAPLMTGQRLYVRLPSGLDFYHLEGSFAALRALSSAFMANTRRADPDPSDPFTGQADPFKGMPQGSAPRTNL